MEDGYFQNNTVIICTDNFSINEVDKLIKVLYTNFGLLSDRKKRRNPNGNIV